MQSSDADSAPPSPGWGVPLALMAAIFFVYLFISMCSTIWDRDEARFSRATTEMVSSGNYLVPTFNGKLRPDKPILIYWLMSIPVRMFGHTEWAYRLCSVLGTALACFFTYFIGRRLFNHRTGLWAMAILAANPMLAYDGAVATSDAVLLAFMTGAFAVFASSLKNGFGVKHLVLLTLLFAGGMLTKGPVALLPLIPFILTRFILRKEMSGAGEAIAKACASVVIAGLIFAAWFYPADVATKGELWKQSFGHHVLGRITHPLENHGGYSPKWLSFYFIVIVLAFFPWTLYLPGALVRLSRGEMSARNAKVFLLTWIVSFLIVMIAISTKLPHYILPIWPALALCVGAYLDSTAHEDAKSAGRVWTFLGGLLFLAVGLAIAAGIGFGPEYLSGTFGHVKNPEPLWTPFAGDSRSVRSIFGALCLLVTLPVIFRYRVVYYAGNARALLAAALVLTIVAGAFLLPSFERIKIARDLVTQIRARASADIPVTVCGFNEASLIYYLNTNVEDIIPDNPDSKNNKADREDSPKIIAQHVADWANTTGSAVLIIPKPMYDRIKTEKQLPELKQIAEVNGYNYQKNHWVDVIAVRREN